MTDIHPDPHDYPDHETWIGEVLHQLRGDQMAFVNVEGSNPLELERRRAVLQSLIDEDDLRLTVEVDVDTLVVAMLDEDEL